MAQLAFGIAGAAVGAPFGMSSLGFSIGSAIGGALFQETQKFEGPRVGELKATSSTQGAPIPRVYGTDALTGNLIWSSDLIETRKTVKSGGKGGGPKTSTTTYSYSVDMAVMICEGPISGVRKMWFNDRLKFDISAGGDLSTAAASAAIQGSVKIYLGDEVQQPDPTIESYEGAGNVPGHRGTAYAMFTGLQLADYGNARPNVRFEVVSDGVLSGQDGELIGPQELEPWGPDVPYVNNGVAGTAVNGTIQEVQQAIFDVYKDSWNPQARSLINPQEVRLVDSYIGNDSTVPDDRLSSRIRGRGADVLTEFKSFVMRDDVSNDLANVFLWPNGTGGDVLPFNQISYVDAEDATRGPHIIWKTGLSTSAPPLGCMPIALSTGPDYRLWVVRQVTADVQRGLICTGGCSTGDPCVLDQPVVLPEAPEYCIDCTGTVTRNNNGTLEIGGFVGEFLQGFVLQQASDADGVARATQFPAGPVLRYTDPNNNPAWWLSQGVTTPVPVDRACVTSLTEQELTSNKVLLSSIVSDICDRAGITSYDVSELTDLVAGYTVTRQMQGRKALEPLQRAYFFDAVEDDWELKFIKRGGAIGATIPADDMGAEEV